MSLKNPRKRVFQLATMVCLASATIVLSAADEPVQEGEKLGKGLVDRLSSTQLPFTDEDSSLSFEIHPKLGDLVREPYIRLPLEAKYSFTGNREGTVGVIPYFSNPFHNDPVSSDGYLTLGLKQRINDLAREHIDVAVGFDVKLPFEGIPSDLARDSYESFMPYVVAAYRLKHDSRWLGFTSFQYQFVGSDRRDFPTGNADPPDLAIFTPGVIYQPPGDFRYSLQFEYKTDRFDNGNDDGFKVIPGITWFPAPETPVFKSIAGHFELSLDLEYAISEIEEEEVGSDLGLSLQVRWRLFPKRPELEESVF